MNVFHGTQIMSIGAMMVGTSLCHLYPDSIPSNIAFGLGFLCAWVPLGIGYIIIRKAHSST